MNLDHFNAGFESIVKEAVQTPTMGPVTPSAAPAANIPPVGQSSFLGTQPNFFHKAVGAITPDSFMNSQIDKSVNGSMQPGGKLNLPGDFTKGLIASNPEWKSRATQGMANVAANHVKSSPLTQLTQIQDDPNYELVRNQIAGDRQARNTLNTALGEKTYGLARMNPSGDTSFTPGNFQMGNFLDNHGGKLAIALLLLSMLGGATMGSE